jgi:hypothetical protein
LEAHLLLPPLLLLALALAVQPVLQEAVQQQLLHLVLPAGHQKQQQACCRLEHHAQVLQQLRLPHRHCWQL